MTCVVSEQKRVDMNFGLTHTNFSDTITPCHNYTSCLIWWNEHSYDDSSAHILALQHQRKLLLESGKTDTKHD